jgi:type IV pilus assembly protein PilY1
MKRSLHVALVAAAVAAAVLSPVLLLADVASCSVNVAGFADAILNPSRGEDTEFFVSSGGVPNIMFVLDTSGSMRRLPPDGATTGWGTFERAGNAVAGQGYGCSNSWANTRTFNSACGTTTLEGSAFNPSPGLAPPDFAQAKDTTGRYCPYMVAGNLPPKTDKPGFDPDFYDAGASKPWFFQPGRVYHDAIQAPVSGSDGWTDWTASPTAHATAADFCNQWAADPAKASRCGACLRDQGYFFDGSYLSYVIYLGGGGGCGSTADCAAKNAGTCVADATLVEYSGPNDGTAHCRLPNVWFSGNFLNFYPPKFVLARKVLKDVLQSVRKVRLGLTTLNSAGDGGNLLEGLNPPCSMLGSPSSFDANRSAILNAINSATKMKFDGYTPLAEALLDVGNLYLTRSATWFDGTYEDTNFEEKAGNNKSVCFSCQASAALVISDGIPTYDGRIPGPAYAAKPMTLAVANQPGSLAGMAGYNITGISAADCPVCETAAEAPDTSIAAGTCLGQQASGACNASREPIPAYLPKVAWYLYNMDFRPDTEAGSDGVLLARKQGISTYTIGLGTRGNASRILEHAAEAGGGLYNGGSGSDVTDAKSLKDAIMRVLEDVNTRSTSFGAASLSTLQIASSQGVLIPRFEPSRSAHWDGHLYAFDLYSEFAGGCRPQDPATSGPANKDYDCDGKCSSVYLRDADGHFIQEDGTGAFKKNLDRGKAACGSGSLCAPSQCSGPDLAAPARPFWDAGSKLAPVKTSIDPVSGIAIQSPNPDFSASLEWNRRAIYTVVDDSGDGKLSLADTVIEFSRANAGKLVPYLNVKGTRFCQKLASRLAARGNAEALAITTDLAAGGYTACASVIIDFVRGADVFDERGCASYPTTANPGGAYCTRKYQLGDVFHSSPIEVWPPLPSDGYSCPRGLHPQCLQSLFSASIPNPATVAGNANAYDDYAKSDRYKNRRKFVLVGANDGMLHAFRIDRAFPRAGEEIWAFVPPDLLPKVRLLTENVHQFFVDATPMVRDVWLDGVPNDLPLGGAAANGVREAKEFHTVAVVGERRGGTRYFALDVTEAAENLAARPKFLWLFPQPTDPASLAMGETYVEFVPKPPPIGPVKIDRGPGPCAGNLKLDPDGSGRCFEERWIALLSGGFDPQYTRGRGVYMVDLATGDALWDFAQPSGPASNCDASDDPRCHLNYPVAATVGMMMWGNQPAFLSAAAVNGYFDTATFGDTGGQLWVLRFNEPGRIDPATGKVANWYGARVFQHGLNASTPACGLGYCDGQPFFYISSNLPLAANGLYRTLAGTGDRFNVLDPVGGTCGPDNIRACLLKGCTVTLGDGAGGPGAVYGVEPLLGKQTYAMSHPPLCSGVNPATYRYDVTAPGAAACTTITSRVEGITITCPSTRTCSGAAETTTKRASLVCTADSCEPAASNEFGIPIDTKGNPDKTNWFFSVLVFEKTGDRGIFRTLEEARKYDAARLRETDLKNVNAADANPVPANLASPEDRGWSYFFDHGAPSTTSPWTIPIAGVSHSVYRTDERTASVSAIEYGCVFWNTLQTGIPAGGYDPITACPINSPCKAGRAQVSYLYGANAGTGALCLKVDGVSVRTQKNETLVPPHIGKLVAYVGEGQVAFGLTSVRVPQGGANVQLGEVQDLASQTQWLPLDRGGHACRHAPKESQPGYAGPPPDPICK